MSDVTGGVTAQRALVLHQLADWLRAKRLGHPVRVGIDGVCGVGKSTFARQLADTLETLGSSVILLDSDGFHHPRERRHRQGRNSAQGYYTDAYDFQALAELVLRPLGPGGSRWYAVKVHDVATDAVVTDARQVAAAGAILIFDATFIQSEALDDAWDVVIYLQATEQLAAERGIRRDAEALGGELAARAAYDARYMAACRLYIRERDPRARASVVIINDDPDRPVLERIGPAGTNLITDQTSPAGVKSDLRSPRRRAR